jgi:hypothetical protein
MKWSWRALGLGAAYLLIVSSLMGLRLEHVLLVGFLVGLYKAHPKGKMFVTDFLPFALFGALYDLLRIYPKSWAGPIHVAWPYHLEMFLFGFTSNGVRIIPNDFFLTHHLAALDAVTAVTYSLHMVIPVGLSFLFWKQDRDLARQFSWAFFVANVMAFITYVALPVAPPWYVEQYGLTPANWSVPASAAGLVRFDQMIGIPYFQGVYSKSSWVFGAMPSMHAGFPFLNILFARKVYKKGLIPLVTFMLLVWFSAVYLRHHYIVDLIVGVIYVSVAYAVVSWKTGELGYTQALS